MLLDSQIADILAIEDIVINYSKHNKYANSITVTLTDMYNLLLQNFKHQQYAIGELTIGIYSYYIESHVRTHSNIVGAFKNVIDCIGGVQNQNENISNIVADLLEFIKCEQKTIFDKIRAE